MAGVRLPAAGASRRPEQPSARSHARPWPHPWPRRYLRRREPVLAALLLAHALLLRCCSLPTMLRLLPAGALQRLPWLLRATGAESLALFPLGFKVGGRAGG